jgi:hypothetical protein
MATQWGIEKTSLINGAAVSFSSIKVNLNGVVINHITGVNYSVVQEKSNEYGIGSQPISRGYGNVVYEGSITISFKELLALRRAASLLGYNSITELPVFNMVVSFTPPTEALLTTDILYDIDFLEDNFSISDGDMETYIDIPFIFGKLQHKI